MTSKTRNITKSIDGAEFGDATFGSNITAAGNITAGGNIGTATGIVSGATVTATTLACTTGSFSGTTASTSTSTGALTVAGGLGIGGQATANNASITASTASTTTGTGALVVTGGAGVGGQVTAGGKLKTTDTTDLTNFTADGSITTAGGVSVGKNIYVQAGVLGIWASGNGIRFFTNTTVATSDAGTNQYYLRTTTGAGGTLVLELGQVVTGQPCHFNLARRQSGTATDVYCNIYGVGGSNGTANYTNTEWLQQGYDNGATSFVVRTNSAGTGTLRPLKLSAGTTNTGQLILQTDGNVTSTGTIASKHVNNLTAASSSGTTLTLVAADVLGTYRTRTGTGASTDTLPTAAQLHTALNAINMANYPCSFQYWVDNQRTGIITIAPGTGGTLAGSAVINNSRIGKVDIIMTSSTAYSCMVTST